MKMATQKKVKQSVGMKIHGIHLISHELHKVQEFPPVDTVFKFTVNIDFIIGKEDRIIAVAVETIIFSDDHKEPFAKTVVRIEFQLDSFADVIVKEEDVQPNIEENLYLSLIAISLSTVRGVLFDLLRGTYLHRAYMPLMDPRSFHSKK